MFQYVPIIHDKVLARMHKYSSSFFGSSGVVGYLILSDEAALAVATVR